jgi:O-antigen/teichoic acid export membrane protein
MISTFLKKVSVKFKIDASYIAKGGSLLFMTQIVSAVIGLGMTIAFTNLLAVETYGIYKYVLSVYGLLTILSFSGIDTAVMRATSQGKDGSLMQGFYKKLTWGTLASFASLVFSIVLYFQHSTQLATAFVIVAAIIPINESGTLWAMYLHSKKYFRQAVILDVAQQIFTALILLASIIYTQNFLIIVAAYFIPQTFIRLGFLYWINQRFVKNHEIDPELGSYGRSFTFFQIVSRIIGSIDQIVLFHFLGGVGVALFALAEALPNRIQSIYRITGTLAFPQFAKSTPDEIVKKLPKRMLMFGVVILISCIAYVLVAPYIFAYIFPKYMPALHYTQVLVFMTLVSVGYPFGAYLAAHKKIKEMYILSASTVFVKIVVLAIFVPLYGIWGAVFSVLAESATNIGVTMYIIARDRIRLNKQNSHA